MGRVVNFWGKFYYLFAIIHSLETRNSEEKILKSETGTEVVGKCEALMRVQCVNVNVQAALEMCQLDRACQSHRLARLTD